MEGRTLNKMLLDPTVFLLSSDLVHLPRFKKRKKKKKKEYKRKENTSNTSNSVDLFE